MKISNNKPLPFGKNKFYNVIKGKKENGYTFYLPTFCISPKKNLNWDMSIFSIFFAVGKYFYQFNICEVIRDTSTEVCKEDMLKLIAFLKSENLSIIGTQMQEALTFLKKNKHIVTLIKNSELKHPYISTVILSSFEHQPFICLTDDVNKYETVEIDKTEDNPNEENNHSGEESEKV